MYLKNTCLTVTGAYLYSYKCQHREIIPNYLFEITTLNA
jgi:hypothetical protein